MKRTKSILVAASMALAMALTFSCSSGNDPDDNGGSNISGDFNENSQVYNRDGSAYTSSGVIEMALEGMGGHPVGEGSEGSVNVNWDPSLFAGSVTNGVVNLELPRIPDETRYFSVPNSGCTAFSEGVKISSVLFVLTNSNREFIGELEVGYIDEQIAENMEYWYFSKAGKFICDFEEEDSYNDEIQKYRIAINIDAKAGWNKMYLKTSYNEGNRTREELNTNNILTKEMRWTLDNWR
jgi:hypothetical protein